MSVSEDSTDGGLDSPYPRTNYYGDLDAAPSDDDDGPHDTKPPLDRAAIVAYDLLRRSGTILCGRDLAENDRETELTDPVLRPPSDSVSEQRHRRRCNPETGWINWGEGTTSVVKDRPADEFLRVVETALDVYQVYPSKRERALSIARSLKHDPDGPGDVEILGRVIDEVTEWGTR